jgi:hypothetical protein
MVMRGECWCCPVRDGRPRAGFLEATALALVGVVEVRVLDGVTLSILADRNHLCRLEIPGGIVSAPLLSAVEAEEAPRGLPASNRLLGVDHERWPSSPLPGQA